MGTDDVTRIYGRMADDPDIAALFRLVQQVTAQRDACIAALEELTAMNTALSRQAAQCTTVAQFRALLLDHVTSSAWDDARAALAAAQGVTDGHDNQSKSSMECQVADEPHPWDVQQSAPSWREMYEEARQWGAEQKQRAEQAEAEVRRLRVLLKTADLIAKDALRRSLISESSAG